jgi:hypothetical protein
VGQHVLAGGVEDFHRRIGHHRGDVLVVHGVDLAGGLPKPMGPKRSGSSACTMQ